MSKDNDTSSGNDRIHRLVKMADSEEEPSLVRPSERAIQAYMQGTASRRQKREVRNALNRSSAFRRELLEMAEEMETWASVDTPENVAEADIEILPDLFKHVQPVKATAAPSIMERIRGLLTIRIVAPAIATAALAILVVTRLITPGSPHWVLVAESVDKVKLISQTTRLSVSQIESRVYDNPRDAALAAFRPLLNFDYEDTVFRFNPGYLKPLPEEPSCLLYLHLTDDGDKILSKFQANLPLLHGNRPEQVQAWLLSLPSRRLCSLDMLSDTASVVMPKENESMGCVTFTFKVEGGYRPSSGATFSLR